MIKVLMDESAVLDLLLDRCDYWDSSKSNKDLYEQMYQRCIDDGVFEDTNLDPIRIVDNDVVNYCAVLYFEDKSTRKDFVKLLRLYRDGEYDVSCEDLDNRYSFIEAVSDDEQRILVRW